MTTKNCANVPKLVLKDLCEKSFVQNVLYSWIAVSATKMLYHEIPCTFQFHIFFLESSNKPNHQV